MSDPRPSSADDEVKEVSSPHTPPHVSVSIGSTHHTVSASPTHSPPPAPSSVPVMAPAAEQMFLLMQQMVAMQAEANRTQAEASRRQEEMIARLLAPQISPISDKPFRSAVPTDRSLPFSDPRSSRMVESNSSSTARRPLFSTPPPVRPYASPAPVQRESVPLPVPLSDTRPDAEAAPRLYEQHKDMKLSGPSKFKGTDKERLGARDWLERQRDYIYLTAGSQPQSTQLMIFGMQLEDGASSWFNNQKRREGAAWTLERAFESFLETYTGGVTVALLEAELEGLRYGGENTKDLAALNARFDLLSQQLYPGSLNEDSSNRMLARMYENIIMKGDFELWEKARNHDPVGLDQWKLAVQNAYVVLTRQRKARRDRSTQNSTGSRPWFKPAASTVKVNRMKTSEAEGEGETWERREGEEGGEGEEVAQMQATSDSKGRRGGGGAKTGSGEQQKGYQLTPAERGQLMAKGVCFRCYKAGHLSRDCPDKGKPRRAPTQEDLKA